MSLDHRFNRVSDDFTAGERVAHPRVTHSNTVIYTYSIEFEGATTGFTDSLLHNFTELLQMYMSRNYLNEGVSYTYEWFPEILLGKTDSSQQAALRRLFNTFLDCIAAHRLLPVRF